MQPRRQLCRRPQPTTTGPDAGVRVAALLMALCLAGSVAQDTASSPAPSPDDGANHTSPCTCSEGNSLNCSSKLLAHVEAEYDTCELPVEILDVSNNLLESIQDLEQWYDVKLNASFNKIREIISGTFFNHVEVMDVSWNEISKLEIDSVEALRELNVSHNKLVRLEALPHTCELRWLDLSHNLMEEIPDGLNECNELQMLNVSNNAFHTFPVGALDVFLTSKEDNKWANLVVDLRGNNLTSDDSALLEFLKETNVTVSANDCSCAKLARGTASFTLCVSALCIDGTELWSSVNSAKAPSDTLPDTPRIGSTDNKTACEEDCANSSISADPTTTDTSSVTSTSPTSTADESSTTNSSPSLADETTTPISLPSASDELSTTASSSTAAPSTTDEPTTVSAAPLPPVPAPPAAPPQGGAGNARRGGLPEGTPPPRPPPPPPAPEPTTPAPGPTPADGRRRRRLYVTLGLTLVVLLAAGAGAAALFTIYRRRRRQLLEEQTQRVAMMPLVDTGTPRSLRAADDDFVP